MLTWEGYGNRSVSYPEHVLTWEGYGNRSVGSCVRVCTINSYLTIYTSGVVTVGLLIGSFGSW